MLRSRICVLLLSLCYLGKAFSLSVSLENANKIGERIWKNECRGSVEGLTCWNKGENFASFGIGHFIWYSQGKKERFQETFPDLLVFLQKNGVALPSVLKTAKVCPWNSREEFYESIQSPEMNSLRQFLVCTRGLQAVFIANRLETSFAQMLEKCSAQEKNKISIIFTRLSEDANGLYALIDYLNFKGAGISENETYNGQGWGLLQVLQNMLCTGQKMDSWSERDKVELPRPSKPIAEGAIGEKERRFHEVAAAPGTHFLSSTEQNMPDSSDALLINFVRAAKDVLSQRVKNSPPERNENQWMKGWCNRLDTYLSQ